MIFNIIIINWSLQLIPLPQDIISEALPYNRTGVCIFNLATEHLAGYRDIGIAEVSNSCAVNNKVHSRVRESQRSNSHVCWTITFNQRFSCNEKKTSTNGNQLTENKMITIARVSATRRSTFKLTSMDDCAPRRPFRFLSLTKVSNIDK